ncbi:MAG: hypothetical protein JW996_04475 [Candidatus Cloacimonetes bacterium]|nr:hypothetical protein [Candidatus Cloacimonadota bacterium]
MPKKFSLWIVIILAGCSTFSRQQYLKPVSMNVIYRIYPDFKSAKALYSASEKTLYALDPNNSKIHIYHEGKKINVIGGLGFSQGNFSRIADIALTPDGKLLVLDSFEKKISRFDRDGKMTAEFDLTDLPEPVLLDLTIDEKFYFYDRNYQEVIFRQQLNDDNYYEFGKFQIRSPDQLTVTRNYVILYSRDEDCSFVFDRFGQFISEDKGYVQYDRKVRYDLAGNYITSGSGAEKFALSPERWTNFMIREGYCTIISDREIQVLEIIYENISTP